MEYFYFCFGSRKLKLLYVLDRKDIMDYIMLILCTKKSDIVFCARVRYEYHANYYPSHAMSDFIALSSTLFIPIFLERMCIFNLYRLLSEVQGARWCRCYRASRGP